MYFWFSEGFRSINDITWLQLKLVYSVSERHEGSNLAPLTKEESVETSDMYLLFLFGMCLFKGMGLNCLSLFWAEIAMDRIDQRLVCCQDF